MADGMAAKLAQIKQMATDLVAAVEAVETGEGIDTIAKATPDEGAATEAPETTEEPQAPAEEPAEMGAEAPAERGNPLSDYLKGKPMKKRMM